MATTEIHVKADLGSLRIEDSHRSGGKTGKVLGYASAVIGAVVIIAGLALWVSQSDSDSGSGDGAETGNRRALGDIECQRIRHAAAKGHHCGKNYRACYGRLL